MIFPILALTYVIKTAPKIFFMETKHLSWTAPLQQ